jgi:hypothetical protein
MRIRMPMGLFVATLVFTAAIRAENPSPRPMLRDFMGINGHTVQFKPDLYRPAGRLVRDYHPVSWDLGEKTAEPAPFPLAKNRVDWNKVYGSWKEKGWIIDACLMFESIPRDKWGDFEKDAQAYAEAFAREFGPSGKRRLVESVEIGNEPGKWKDEDYTKIFRAMAGGIRAGDPRLKIATCNLRAGKSGDYDKSVECVASSLDLVDVLTVHTYAQLENWPTWRRSFPEDPKLPHYLQDVEALCRWRDTHAAGKPVWITEFGYDSTTEPPEKTGDFVKWVGVTDTQQAQWLVRSFLVFSAMPVERCYLYFFNDDDKASLHASSGLTRKFQPKPSYHAVAHLLKMLGDYRFERMVADRSGQLRVQEYGHGDDPKKFAWAVWSPTGEGRLQRETLTGFPGRLTDVREMPLSDAVPAAMPAVGPGDSVELEVKESPVYLFFEKS